jgi:hypothetical protein
LVNEFARFYFCFVATELSSPLLFVIFSIPIQNYVVKGVWEL